MSDDAKLSIREIQAPLRRRYTDDPAAAKTTLTVRGGTADLSDPLHCTVAPDSVPGTTWRSGAHPAVGGTGDVPCSADLLLGALVACQETTIRMVAANMGIELERLEISAEADWDPRGTLAMGRDFPVGLTAIRCTAKVGLAEGVKEDRAERLLRSAERYCVVLDTLRKGVPVESAFAIVAAGG
jgi:uncharacterized OsmC-like protein